jgi:uncharacterized protein with GYD domain
MVQASYTQSAWAAMVKKPQDRGKTVGAVIAKMGGKLHDFWMAFGEFDIVAVAEMPDDVSMAAFAMAVGAGGACSAFRTTRLLSAADGMAALKKARKTGYKPAK